MAHLVVYDGDQLCPSVTMKVGAGKGMKNAHDDVMLVSVLLKMYYARKYAPRLPPGARRVIVPGPRFTPETEVFIRDAQKLNHWAKVDGFVGPLPPGASSHRLELYLVFHLFYIVCEEGENDTLIDALTKYPYLSHLRSMIWGPVPTGSETVAGAPDPSGEHFPRGGGVAP